MLALPPGVGFAVPHVYGLPSVPPRMGLVEVPVHALALCLQHMKPLNHLTHAIKVTVGDLAG